MSSEDETTVGGDEEGWNQLELGTKLENYRIERLLGQGGMGTVYLAEHERLGQKYALKVLPRELSGDANFQQRFVEEGRRMASLEHPHIVPIHYAGEAEGLHYFAMQYLSGGDLESALWSGLPPPTENRPLSTAHRIPPTVVRDYLQQLLEALAYAHGQGVVNRDLKPANLLLTEGGQLKVTDFGLAQVVGKDYMRSLVEKTVRKSMLGDAATVAGRQPSSGQTSYAGTIDFMAPEVRNGQGFDARSDLYAVGVIGYYLLTGKKPFGRYKDASKLVEDLDPAWDDFLDDLMAGDPEDRIQSAEAALAALSGAKIGNGKESVEVPNKIAAQEPVRPAPSASPAPAEPSQSGDKGLWFGMAAAWLLALGIGGWAFGVYLPQERAFEAVQERVAALPLTAESYEVERLATAVKAYVAGAPGRHVVPVEEAWSERREEVEVHRQSFEGMRERVGELEPDSPMAQMEEIAEAVESYLRWAPESYRDRIAAEWEQRRAATEDYWRNARGELILNTEPSGAEVRIGSRPIVESPVRLSDLRLGSYAIDVVSPYYERWSGVAEVEDGRFTDLGTIELQRSTGRLRVSANLESFDWTLEQDAAEIEPRQGAGAALLEYLPTGSYTLKAQRDGWPEQVHDLEIVRNEIAETVLEFPHGSLRLTSKPSGAAIWDGGERIGVTPYNIGELPPGDLQGYQLRKEGYGVHTLSGHIEAGEELVLAVELVEVPYRGENYTVDLGDGVTMEFVWLAALNAWVGQYEVTNSEYRRFDSSHDSGHYEKNNRRFALNGDRQPAVLLNYNEAVAFSAWLSGQDGLRGTGIRARLLTGDEWTAIARCGTNREFPWGDSWPPTRGNYSDLTAREELDFTGMDGYRDGFAVTAPVEASGRNKWGLYGVGGNVWEWTSEARGSLRVLRGASWGTFYSRPFRVEFRYTYPPSSRRNDAGFRVLLAER